MRAQRVLVFDAIDFRLPPGTLQVLRDDEVPAWGRAKLSPHQTGFNDVLALAQLQGRAPETIIAIGVQPVELDDFGGSLRGPSRRACPRRWPSPRSELAAWGIAGRARAPGDRLRAAQRGVARARRVRAGSPVRGRRLPRSATRAARARRSLPRPTDVTPMLMRRRFPSAGQPSSGIGLTCASVSMRVVEAGSAAGASGAAARLDRCSSATRPWALAARVPGPRGARHDGRGGRGDRCRARRARSGARRRGRRFDDTSPTSSDREPELPAHLQGT